MGCMIPPHRSKVADKMATRKVCGLELEGLLEIGYQHYEKLETELSELVRLRQETIKQLQEIADELDKHHKRVNVAKMVGSSVGIIGGIVNIVGLALIPVSLGVSVIVAAAGAGVAAAGGITASGAQAIEFVITNKRMKKAQKAIDDDRQQTEKVKVLWNEFEEISRKIFDNFDEDERPSVLENERPSVLEKLKAKWRSFEKWASINEDEAPPRVLEEKLKENWRSFKKWASEFKMSCRVQKALFCWDLLSTAKSTVRGGVAVYDVGVAVLRGLEEAAKHGAIATLVIRCIGLTAMLVLDYVFTAIGLIIVDIYTFISTAIDISKGSHSAAGNQLREIISKLQKEEERWNNVFLM